MTLFLAAVLHGIIILGITFSASNEPQEQAPGLEVLLVSDELPTADQNDHATFLAQRTQLGAGNTEQPGRPHNRPAADPRPAQQGQPDGVNADHGAASATAEDDRVLASSTPQPQIRYFGEIEASAVGADAQTVAAQPKDEPGPQDDPGPVQLRGPRRDELWVTPDTRESALAPYLDSWRRRVERIGTLNFPAAARHALGSASPVLEVAIDADGSVSRMVVRRSSGDPELDQAALQILKLASPFDRFPAELAARYRTLRFVYEYQFVGGRLENGAVRTVP